MSENENQFKFDFDRDTKIDPSKLHEECFTYANLSWRYGEAVAAAKKELDRAHEKVKVTRSRLILEARKDPEGCGLGKSPKNDEIESYYRTHPEHEAAKQDMIEKEYRHSVLLAGYNSVQFGKRAGLEGAITLWKGEYFTIEGLPIEEVPQEWLQGWEDKRKRDRSETAAEQMDRGRARGQIRRTT